MHPVAALLAKRAALGVVTLVGVSLLIFVGTEILPGDVAQAVLGQAATPEAVASMRHQLGLDQPLALRYLEWLWNFVRGDLGTSLASGRPVAELVFPRLRNTLLRAGTAAAVAVPLSVILGVLAALYRDGPLDRFVSILALLFVSLPEFLVGYCLVLVLAVDLGWLPALTQLNDHMPVLAHLRALALPVATLVLVVTAHTMRLTRAAIVAVLASDYIEMAEIKGLPHFRVITLHALANALSPILNIVMLTLAYLVVGVVVVEVVFNFSGMGKLMVDAVTNRDLPLVQACGLLFSLVYVGLNLLADVLAAMANPRLRHAT